ncbi:MAG: hypothetical protein WC340_01640 [Kiritimatiellia bacterium]
MPTDTKQQRIYFSQQEIANTLEDAKATKINNLLISNNVELADSPLFHTSYDPNPNTFRHYAPMSGPGTEDVLGRDAFGSQLRVDLNNLSLPDSEKLSVLYQLLSTNTYTYNKFNINSITNVLRNYTPASIDLWKNNGQFIAEWLLPAWCISEICRNKDMGSENLVFDKGHRLAWSIANFIDYDRIPDVSNLIEYEMPTRANFAVEDVPLISKISLFNIDDGAGNTDYIGPQDKLKNYNYYNVDPNLSNHYAVAVELWYPFAPNSPFRDEVAPDSYYNDSRSDPRLVDPACYVGIYTNEADVITTTNRPLSSRELENFFGTNIVMKVLFETWAREYTNEVGWAYLDGNPLWQKITNRGDNWFTPAMINSPLWRETTELGEEWFTVVMTNSPLYKTFYLETSGITQTNHWLNIAYPGVTNEFIYSQYTDDQEYMVMYWEDSLTGTITNSLLGGIIDENGDLVALDYTNNIARAIIYGSTPSQNYMISSNFVTAVISTNLITAVRLSPDIEPPQFTTYTNLFNQYTVEQVTPLYIPKRLKLALNELFLMLPTNSISAIHDFMLLTTEDIKKLNKWNELFNYISNSPGIQNTLIPQIIEPSLGNMTEKDKHWLDPDSPFFDLKTTAMTDPDNVNGYFWTVYPKQTISFMEITEQIPPGYPPESEEREIVTNCYALGYIREDSVTNTIWIRPVTTIIGADIITELAPDANARPFTDRIVNEAVMHEKDKNPLHDTVKGWLAPANMYVADPRDNGYEDRWLEFHTNWDAENTNPDIHILTGVKELPFIHFNTPLQTIGDLGHIYTEFRKLKKNESLNGISGNGSTINPVAEYSEEKLAPEYEPADTISFETISGASLLDFFTIKPNKPVRGLVQANTTLKPTLDILFSDVMVGWTNAWSFASGTYGKLSSNNSWPELWAEALTKDQYNTGWRCFADMLPALATNKMYNIQDDSNVKNHTHMHNYIEDVLRGIIDKVSFRQNVFVIILAAQTLAPGTEASENPTVLAEQRAAVTVIRDAYSGNWTIAEWRKLTQ